MSRAKTDNKRIHIQLHEDLAARLDLILADPVTGRLRYGAMSQLSNRLFGQFLRAFDDADDKVAFLKAFGIDLEAKTKG